METSWRDLPGVARFATLLLWRHWPAMFALAFAGVAVRNGAMWAAIRVSDWNSFVAQLILLVVPLGYLLPVIAMLHLSRKGLPNVTELDRRIAAGDGARRERRLLEISASVLVPFLAVYVSYELLKSDRLTFLNNAAYEEHNHFSVDYRADFGARLGIYSVATVLAIVAVSWIARWAVGRFEKRFTFLWLTVVGALIEVYWTGQVARNVDYGRYQLLAWANDRRAAVWVTDHWNGLMDKLGWFAHPSSNATNWLFGIIGSLDAVIVVPIGWLTVAAIVLGHDLETPKQAQPAEPAKHSWWDRLRALLADLVADVRSRWQAFAHGLRLLASAGLVPMLTFAVLFLLVIRIPYLVSVAIRSIAGPIDTDTWLAFSPHEDAIGLSIAMVFTACLLAAATDWLLTARLGTAQDEAAGSTANVT